MPPVVAIVATVATVATATPWRLLAPVRMVCVPWSYVKTQNDCGVCGMVIHSTRNPTIIYQGWVLLQKYMRRAPARPVRACFVRTCCTLVVQEHDLRATPAQCTAKRTPSSHFTLHSSHPALHASHLHFTLRT